MTVTLDRVMKDWASSNEPTIKLNMFSRSGRWLVELVEVWPDDIHNYGKSTLDDKVEWTYQQLKSWPDVSRSSWDMWSFKFKHDAEKFVTLYTLLWAR